MDVRQLKQEIEKLPNIEEAVSEFERHWLKPIKKNTNKGHPFLHVLSQEQKRELNSQLLALNKFLREVKYGQIVNEKLASSAHNLIELKIAALTNDYKKTRRLLSTFLQDPQMGIKQLIFEVPYLESQLSLLNRSYDAILEQLSRQLPLEQTLSLLEGKHKLALKRLLSIPKKQKRYLSMIGTHFVQLSRELKKKKEFQQCFKG